MKQYTNGWHKIAGYNVYIEDNRIVRGVTSDWQLPLCPYTASKYGGWDNASRDLTPDAFRARVRRGTAIMR